MRLVVARCQVDYAGRLTAHLPMATRVLMIKADGSVVVLPPCVGDEPPAVSVGGANVSIRTSLIGACGVGAEAFNVEPSLLLTVGGVGVNGALAFDVQEIARAISEIAVVADRILCCIYGSIFQLYKSRGPGRWRS